MERNEQIHDQAEVTLDQINKKTGRNMPQAIATAVLLHVPSVCRAGYYPRNQIDYQSYDYDYHPTQNIHLHPG